MDALDVLGVCRMRSVDGLRNGAEIDPFYVDVQISADNSYRDPDECVIGFHSMHCSLYA